MGCEGGLLRAFVQAEAKMFSCHFVKKLNATWLLFGSSSAANN